MALLLATPAGAQHIATSFEELRGLVEPGDTIRVTDRSGATITGKLAGLFGSSLDVRARGDESRRPLRLSEPDVNNVVAVRFDSLWNGVLIGFTTGAVSGLFIELAARSEYQAFNGGGAIGLGSMGLLMGLLVDSLNREKETVYVQPAQPRSSTVRIRPLVSNSSAGVHMSVAF